MMQRRQMIVQESNDLSKRKRAELLSVNLSSCYVKPRECKPDDVLIMNEIRDIYEQRPFQGYRRITWDLLDLGYKINRKRVLRLMRMMGLQAIYPKKNLSKRNHQHKIYPYLLGTHKPIKPHDAWCVDITYIRIASGFVYLTALIDVVSRCVMGYHISTSLETESCLRALEMAIKTGFIPKIINTDQGCQFTSDEWIYQLKLLGVKISMDGKGRALDNIPIERFWRTIKYEEVYLKTYDSVGEARIAIGTYIHWYNTQRRHSALNYQRPWDVMTNPKTRMELRGDGYVDKSCDLPHIPTPPTTTNVFLIYKKDDLNNMHLSLKIAV